MFSSFEKRRNETISFRISDESSQTILYNISTSLIKSFCFLNGFDFRLIKFDPIDKKFR